MTGSDAQKRWTGRAGGLSGSGRGAWLYLAPPLLFLLLFYFYPLEKIFLLSLWPEGGAGLTSLARLVDSAVYGRIIWFTTWQAALSTLLSLLLALPCAYIFARFSFRGKALLQALISLPFVLPTVVVAAAFRALLGRHGLANSLAMSWFDLQEAPIQLEQSLLFVLIAHVFYNVGLVVRLVGTFWAQLNPDLPAAATLLGASPWQAFRRIILPLLLPAIGASALLVFIFCFTSFGVVLILGGLSYATLEVEIYRQAIQLFNLPMAASLALIQITMNFVLMWLHGRLARRAGMGFALNVAVRGGLLGGGGAGRWTLVAIVGGVAGLIIAPILALISQSLTNSKGFTLVYYQALFANTGRSVFAVPPITAVGTSIAFAAAATLVAVLLGLLAAMFLAGDKRRGIALWDALLMLPLATSAVTLGFGYIVSLNHGILNLRDSLALVPIAHALVAFPFVVRCILPSLRQIPEALREAAALLGASPWQVWRRVDLPIIARAIVVGAVFAFAISMGEFGATAFVAKPELPTMPVAIFRLLGQPGELNYGQAMAMSTILMVVTASSFLLLARLGHLRTPLPERSRP